VELPAEVATGKAKLNLKKKKRLGMHHPFSFVAPFTQGGRLMWCVKHEMNGGNRLLESWNT